MAWKTSQNGTKHNDSCIMAFGKFSAHDNCPRCNELKAGAIPRKSWNDAVKVANVKRLSAYCFTVPIYHSHCNAQTNPSCNCGKMSYTD
jgi:hypothetical protein